MQLVYGHEKVKLEKIKEIIKGSKLVCKETADAFEKTKQREIREVKFHIFTSSRVCAPRNVRNDPTIRSKTLSFMFFLNYKSRSQESSNVFFLLLFSCKSTYQ